MKIIECLVLPCERKEIKDFVETWHYSKSINGIISDYCFKLMDGDRIIGAAIYGRMAMAGVWKKYVEKPEELIELRRLCCIDETPKNAESRLIGQSIRWLKRNTQVKVIISYADQTYGHIGTIYKATNFENIGYTSPGRVIMYRGKKFHDKCIRTKYNGVLKPFAQEIKTALEKGEAEYVITKPKVIYKYRLL